MPNYTSQWDIKRKLPKAERILVIGCSGGGKSTLSRKIAAKFDLPLFSLDRDVRWLPGWQQRDRIEQRKIISQLVEQDRWVMDGSGATSFDLRLPRTELILWIRVPRYLALAGVTRRSITSLGRVRPEMAAGCPERLPDRDFLSYIWHFEKKSAPQFERQIDQHGADIPVAVLTSHRMMDDLLE